MPPIEEAYLNSVIYTIQHKTIPELLYIGSTTNFKTRSNVHKYNCTNPKSNLYNQNLYEIMRKNGGWDAFTCSIYKNYSCFNKWALLIEEDRILDDLKPLLNKNRSYLTIEDKKLYQVKYKQKNKEKLYRYYKLWLLSNKDKLEEYKEKYKEYYKTPKSIAYHKNYYDEHKEKYKQYYQDNKERIKKKYDDAKAKAQEYRKSIN
jgi:hypothetical protein